MSGATTMAKKKTTAPAKAEPPKKLPKKMHFSYGRYYIVHKNKWIPLSRVEHEAMRMYADFMRDLEIQGSKIADVVEEYRQLLEARVNKEDLADQTYKNYRLRGVKFVEVFRKFPSIEDITYHDLFDWRESFELCGQHAMWNLTHSYLKGLFAWCRDKKYTTKNEFLDLKKLDTKSRTRLIQEWEYKAIYEHADPILRSVMDLADLCGQRIGDVIGIEYADILDEHLLIVQKKTGARIAVVITDEVRGVISTAKSVCNIEAATTLFHHLENGGNTSKYQRPAGRPMSYGAIYARWADACEKAKIEDAHIHDLRAKSATRADANGGDAQGLLGHGDKRTTEIYLRGWQYEEVMPATKIGVAQDVPLIKKRTPKK